MAEHLFPIKALISFFILALIFTSVGAIPVHETFKVMDDISNQTGMTNYTHPLYLGYNQVFQIIGGIFWVATIGMIFLYAFMRVRQDEIQ